MAFPSAGTPVSTPFSTSVTSMPVTMPATVNAGDLLLAFVHVRNAGTWTKPTGWSEIPKIGGGNLSQAGGGSVGKFDGFYKIADGTEAGTTPTWTASVSTTGQWHAIRITGWHGTTPPEGTTASGDATNANPPSATPSWGSDDNLWIAVAGNSATGETSGFTAAPTNYSNLQSNGTSSGGSSVNLATATRQLAASVDDPGTFTPNSNRFWAAATVVVSPASGATTTSTSSSTSISTSSTSTSISTSSTSTSHSTSTSQSTSTSVSTSTSSTSTSTSMSTSTSISTSTSMSTSTSSTSTSQSTSTTQSTSTSVSTSTTTTLPPSGGIAWGEQNPTMGETPVVWPTWDDGSGGAVTVIGDPNWGKLQVGSGLEARSGVYDFGNSDSRQYTLTKNRYGTGSGSSTLQIRGDTVAFAQDNNIVAWENYTAPITRSWRYVQVREAA